MRVLPGRCTAAQRVLGCRCAIFLIPALAGLSLPRDSPPPPSRQRAVQPETELGGRTSIELPLLFQPRGAKESCYVVRDRDRTFWFAPDGVTIVLRKKDPASSAVRRCVLQLKFQGSDGPCAPTGEERTACVVNRFRGGREAWQTGIPTFSAVRYRELWTGIDLAFRFEGRALKYEFDVRPGADPRRIRFLWRGANSVRLQPDGSLEASTDLGSVCDLPPQAWQTTSGRRAPVAARYLLQRTAPHEWSAGFILGDYDRSRTLVLDPAVLVYSGFVGGSNWDCANAVAVDGDGNAYLAGHTESTEEDFPVTVGPDLTYTGPEYVGDAWVAKISADGSRFLYLGYIGGLGYDEANAVAVDASGSAYLAGLTDSLPRTFPVRIGPSLSYTGPPKDDGGGNAWVAKVRPDGTGLEYCGYVGGSRLTLAQGIAVDGSGAAYLAGTTYSGEDALPVRGGPGLTYGGRSDGWVAKVAADGSSLEYCGYIGGSGYDFALSVAVDARGRAFVAGATTSTPGTFPVRAGPGLVPRGDYEAFVAAVKADGSGLDYCGYIAGTGWDKATGIAVDRSGSAFVAGETTSREDTFPVAVGPDLTANSGPPNDDDSGTDAFVARVRVGGSGLTYCGYIGGRKDDGAAAIALEPAGRAWIAGHTYSPQASFPARGGPDLTFNSICQDPRDPPCIFADAFVARVSADGRSLDHCGYIGGYDGDSARAIAVDGEGAAYVAGMTWSGDSFPVRNSIRRSPMDWDQSGWVAKVAEISGAAGRLQVRPRAIRLPPTPVGSTRSFPVQIRNASREGLTVSLPSLGAPFQLEPAGDVLLPPWGSLRATLRFAPKEARDHKTSIAITSSDPHSPLVLVRVKAPAIARRTVR